MAEQIPEYKIYAIRYATRDAQARDHFLGGDPHDGPMPMDYFVWVVVGEHRTVMVDTGFTKAVAQKRKRTFLRCPVDALQKIDVHADDISDVVLTHLHNDHAGNLNRFPNAQFHLQESEIHFATGRHMRFAHMSRPYELDHVCGLVRLNYNQRVMMYQGDVELAGGISLHATGGHSAGLQFVRVHTARGWVVLASDVSHFYANVEERRPFPLALHVGDMLEGFERLVELSETSEHIIPGHDPEVMVRYQPPSPDLEGIIVRIDLPPSAPR